MHPPIYPIHRPAACRASRRSRTGSTVVESAITLPATLLLLMALLDLGLATLQYNSLGHASRLLARAVALRGAESQASSSLGPATIAGLANDGSEAAQTVNTFLTTMPLGSVSYRIEWLDADNGAGDRIHVELTFTHQPIVPGFNVWGPMQLTAASTMRIVN
jgi:Flp pilus assembly protein TadG